MMGIIAALLGYLLGSVPFGLYVCKVWAKIDVRDYGSGNIGVSNVYRTVGPVPAILVLLLDAGKGALAVVLARSLFGVEPIWILLSGLTAIAGHNWSAYLHFKGGKGVATTAGVMISLAPAPAAVLVAIWALMLFITRYISVASLVAAVSLPILLFVFGYPTSYFVIGLFLTGFTVFRHRSNIQKLRMGQEYKFGEKAKKL